jgi:hypothetical protein
MADDGKVHEVARSVNVSADVYLVLKFGKLGLPGNGKWEGSCARGSVRR